MLPPWPERHMQTASDPAAPSFPMFIQTAGHLLLQEFPSQGQNHGKGDSYKPSDRIAQDVIEFSEAPAAYILQQFDTSRYDCRKKECVF